MSGVFSIASHSLLQYLPDAITHEQTGVHTSGLSQASFRFSCSQAAFFSQLSDNSG